MKKRYFIIFLALPFLVLSCVQENLQTESTGTTISITVTLSAEADTPNTKISLEQDILDLILEWEVGDAVDLCLVYNKGGTTIYNHQQKTVIIDPGNRKRATFSIDIQGDVENKFDLYGLYGGDGFQENSALVKLPDNPVADTEEGIRKAMVLTFEQKDIEISSPSLSVNFSHLGSVFKILVNNTDATNFDAINGIKKIVIASTTATPLGIHINDGTGTGRYDFTTGNFSGTKSETTLSFELLAAVNLNPGTSQELWGWFIPTDDNWPELQLKLLDVSDNVLHTTSNTKAARTAPTAPGKTYHFFADYDNTVLTFSNVIRGKFTDPRDGNVYKTVKIGNKIVMAENLRFLPEVMGRLISSSDDPCYYVYGLGQDAQAADVLSVEDAKATDNYKIYGVLYNWPAAMNGATTSDTSPSGVQGICPDGWHLPSIDELLAIFQAHGTAWTTRGIHFKAIGNTTNGHGLWDDPNTNADNVSGFTALPGGSKSGTSETAFSGIGKFASFYTSTQSSTTNARRPQLRDYDGNISNNATCVKHAAHSVRCVKNY